MQCESRHTATIVPICATCEMVPDRGSPAEMLNSSVVACVAGKRPVSLLPVSLVIALAALLSRASIDLRSEL